MNPFEIPVGDEQLAGCPTFTTDRDRNGNRIVRVTVPGNRPFTVQTLGNLTLTHRQGICPATAGEVGAYVRDFGTVRQRELLGV